MSNTTPTTPYWGLTLDQVTRDAEDAWEEYQQTMRYEPDTNAWIDTPETDELYCRALQLQAAAELLEDIQAFLDTASWANIPIKATPRNFHVHILSPDSAGDPHDPTIRAAIINHLTDNSDPLSIVAIVPVDPSGIPNVPLFTLVQRSSDDPSIYAETDLPYWYLPAFHLYELLACTFSSLPAGLNKVKVEQRLWEVYDILQSAMPTPSNPTDPHQAR